MNKVMCFKKVENAKYVKDIVKIVKYTLKKEKVTNGVVNVILVDDDEIRNLNKTYRGIDKVTDVISFALEDSKMNIKTKERILGDIYISVPKAISQSISYGHSFKREILFLTVHGTLHLLGYDHMNKEDEEKMFTRQEMILNGFRIKR